MALKYEKSCGALVFRQDPKTGRMYILMIRHKHGGHRSFPKGHVEAGETEHQTAIREVEEETAVKIRITSDFCEKVHYSPMPGVQKEVVYFMATTARSQTWSGFLWTTPSVPSPTKTIRSSSAPP